MTASPRAPSRLAAGAVALCAVAVAMALRSLLDPLLGDRSPFLLFILAVIAAALYGGFWAGVLALIVSLVAGTFAFVTPRGELYTEGVDALANIATFAVTSGVLLWMVRGKAQAELWASDVESASGRAVSATQLLLETVIESVPDPIYVKDAEGRLLIVNSATARVFGQPRQSVVGRRDRDFLPEDAAGSIEAVDREVLAGRTQVVEELIPDPERGLRDYLSTKSPMRDNAGVVTGLVGVSRDITERKLAERELVRLNRDLELRVQERTRQLQDANAELQSFAYSVAHDLRAPLRAMKGFSQALAEDYADSLDETGREYLGRIDDGATRLDLLIQDLLAYSRLSQEEFRLERVDLDAVVDQALEQLAAAVSASGARVDISRPLPCVRGHHRVLVQVVANLLSNAIKFVAPGAAPQIRLHGQAAGGRVRLQLEDNGIGIAREHQGRVFEVFQRLHGMTQYAGTGIGLAIVKKGVERLGGSVGVVSEPGAGSRFWIELEAG
jgi:PAS domain S-box-containing protein